MDRRFSISASLLFAGLSLVSRSRGYIYLAAPILNYAATRVYIWPDPERFNVFNSTIICRIWSP